MRTKRSSFGSLCTVGVAVCALGLGVADCKKKNNDNGGGPMQGSNDQSLHPSADLQGAYGLLIVDNSQSGGTSLALMKAHNKTVDDLKIDAPKFDGIDDVDEKDGLSLAGVPYTLNGDPFSFPGVPNGIALVDSGGGMGGDTSSSSSGNVGTSSGPVDNTGGLKKIDKTSGDLADVISVPEDANKNNMCCGSKQQLPKISTIAVSPLKDVYLQFEQPFVYRTAEDPTANVWQQSSGYQCQVFKVKDGTLDQLLTTAPTADNLECIDNTHFINSWGNSSNSVFQFDQSGNVYYPGTLPNSPNTVVYRRLRDGSQTSEMINANICVQNYLITKLGGVFYTGQTCDSGKNSGGSDGGYFRYISPAGKVIEIARDWWNFIFDTSVADTTAGSTDMAVFFGPYSTSGTTASWDSACLFKFNPAVDDPLTRVSNVISCGGGNDFNDWQSLQRTVDINTYGCKANYFANSNCPDCNRGGAQVCNNTSSTQYNLWQKSAWIAEYKNRCVAKDTVFAGGGSQLNAISQDSAGQVYVNGAIRKKVEGKLTCSVNVRGPHCVVDGLPTLYTMDTTSASAYSSSYTANMAKCTTAGGEWKDKGNCNGTTTDSRTCLSERHWMPTSGCGTDGTDCNTNGKCYLGSGCTDATASNLVTAFTSRWSCDNLITRNDASISCSNKNQSDNRSEWDPESTPYSNVTGDLCLASDIADDAVTTYVAAHPTATDKDKTKAASDARDAFNNWNGNKFQLVANVSAGIKAASDFWSYPKFQLQGIDCSQVGASASSGGNNSGGWTEEYKAMAKVDSVNSALRMMSLPSEQAIKLWIVNNVPYYSSYDTTLRMYLLNTLDTLNTTDKSAGLCMDLSYTSKSTCEGSSTIATDKDAWDASRRACLVSAYTTKTACEAKSMAWRTTVPRIIMSNFEAYNVADGGSSGVIYADGLDFNTNQYQFGTVAISTGKLTMKEGLTGTIKTIVILPK